MSHHSHPSSTKTRHYAHLASRIHHLQQNLSQTEEHMSQMAEQLAGMSRLGAWAGSQFMATSRLLDVDLEKQSAVAVGGAGTIGDHEKA